MTSNKKLEPFLKYFFLFEMQHHAGLMLIDQLAICSEVSDLLC
jgi:hypothetical protein